MLAQKSGGGAQENRNLSLGVWRKLALPKSVDNGNVGLNKFGLTGPANGSVAQHEKRHRAYSSRRGRQAADVSRVGDQIQD
jgi:hypothetical protein